jgi:hypothetical protein
MGRSVFFVQPGQQFDRLTVVDPETRKSGVRAALCRCSCGTADVLVLIKHLVHGRVRSCGCLARDQTIERNRSSASRGGLTRHPLFGTWTLMVNRCHNPNAGNYRWYGERGITVHDEWRENPLSFVDYVEKNLGPRPDGMSLDRIDNDGDYEPGNIRWATQLEQVRNRRKRSA